MLMTMALIAGNFNTLVESGSTAALGSLAAED